MSYAHLKMIVLRPFYLDGGVKPHYSIKGALPALVLLPCLEHLALPHPGAQYAPHPRNHTLPQLITLASIVIHTFVGLKCVKYFIHTTRAMGCNWHYSLKWIVAAI